MWYHTNCDGCNGRIRVDEHSDKRYCWACWEFYEETGGPELNPEERPPSTISNHPSDYDGE